MILQVKVYPTGNTPVTEIAPMDGLRWEMPAIWLGVRLSSAASRTEHKNEMQSAVITLTINTIIMSLHF